ncbi:PREDICTED: cysteine sulfinic acid decarboxylase-like [Acromyrmex echinatior]|uniref:Cysteine sulfinic acid decarboxylase n=1 Tax=Acromyrmex echinatior TaxID=103372 RepID=F4W963_ACREC|nr:PREDICTED: cysteine sulfinic acid decarboxylase-like [Acromyrmex echinatior]EGI69245.1 Cysteine sulfinic acid decarboxylase [Acromyrmex echinatior]
MAESSTSNIIDLLEKLLKIFKEENLFNSDDQPVIQFRPPNYLQKIISISLDDKPASNREIETVIRQTIQFSVKTSNPHFHNQLYAGVDEYGLIGSWITEVLNTSQYTYEVAPVFTLMEREVIQKSLELVGYPLMPEADGIMCPGGSISNMYGMLLARHKISPCIKKSGVYSFDLPLVCFTSEDSHYSIMKSANWLGIGTDNVYKVKTDEFGRMQVTDLKRLIIKAKIDGKQPFFVNATAGTTVFGAIDPLPEIAAVCQSESLWMHVDACLGGTLLFSEKYRNRLRGIELSDSVSWNLHKMLGAPLQCSLFLVKSKNMLYEVNCAQAKYLFQQDKFYDVSWDTGDKSVQCGRKVDAMKFWLMWKARGKIGLMRSVEQVMSCAEYFLKRIKETAGFRLVQSYYQCCNICFWYIPPTMRDQNETLIWWEKISYITMEIKNRLVFEGTLMISYMPVPHKNFGNFFRMVVNCQPPPTKSSMDYVINQIQKVASDL